MKYNWSIFGHENQLLQIESDFESGNLAHAYLLAGPDKVGKFTVAKKMAGILQCENNFCHNCHACLQIAKGTHIDTIELFDDGESIKIEDVRKLIERLNMTRQANYKVLLIQGIERMTTEASNSFLKILEEPPENTIFILTTNNSRDLLPTIVSRVRVVKFNHLSLSCLEKILLENYPNFNKETVEKIGLFAMGKSGVAIDLIENSEVLSEYINIYNQALGFLEHRSVYDKFNYVEELLASEKQLAVFLNMLTNILRSKMLNGENTERNINNLLKIDEVGILLKKNVNSRLVLENLMLNLC
ncbi:hypothetical protein COU74_02710 [Candidatus Peregrinibacteria bacterium CG10_big_fil_rev_8_21_14_0_10_36_19]|nr:MAG: hypothetical protein COU74_02710 [Candidatus Peregrinibacteria bacterium CG10_big_fil_rev_8_21_14_0_10_36_19]